MAERRRTEKQLAEMSADDLTRLARELDEQADDLRAERDRVTRALSDKIEAGDLPADMRPREDI
jgi:hypothetical protein